MDEHKHRAFPSLQQSLRAATGSLEENMLLLLLYWLSSRVKNVLMLCKFRATTSHFCFTFFSCEMTFFLVKWNFHGGGEKLLPTKAAPLASLNLSFIYWSLKKKYDIGTKPHVPNRILCKAAGLNRRPVWGKGACSDSNWTAQWLRWQRAKAWKQCLAWFWIDCNQSL